MFNIIFDFFLDFNPLKIYNHLDWCRNYPLQEYQDQKIEVGSFINAPVYPDSIIYITLLIILFERIISHQFFIADIVQLTVKLTVCKLEVFVFVRFPFRNCIQGFLINILIFINLRATFFYFVISMIKI